MRPFWMAMIILYLYYIYFVNANEIQMIGDIIKSSEQPTSILANVCWEPHKKVQFISELNSMGQPRTIRFMKTEWRLDDFIRREHLMFVVDINCPDVETFLNQASATRKFAFPYRWLIVGGSVNGSILPYSFVNLNLLADSQVIISRINDSYSVSLFMIYKMNPNSHWVYEDYGVWRSDYGLIKPKQMKYSLPMRRKNFDGNIIITAMVTLDNKTKSDPYDLRDVLTDTVSKSGFRQTDAIFFFLNATRQLVFSDTWGYYRNGSYEGMVAEMTQGKAELASTVLITTQDRIEVVDYLSSPTPISIKFVFREPPLSYQNNLFLLPFKTSVWYCIAAFVVMLIFIIYMNALWEKIKRDQFKPEEAIDHTALRPNISDITILVIAAITQQGSSIELKGTLGRLVMFLLFLAFLLLYSSYSASIVALLQSRSNQVRTLTDLLNSKLELGVEDTPYNRYFFPIATEPVRKAIYQTKIAPRGTTPKFMSLEEGVKKLQKEPFAFNMNKGIGYRLVDTYFHEHEKCGLQEIGYLDDTKTYITCRKNSPYREIFKVGLFRIQEHGLSDRENRLIYARKPACIARGGSFGSVNMVDFYPVLLTLLYGTALAFTLLLLEILLHRKQMQFRAKGLPLPEICVRNHEMRSNLESDLEPFQIIAA